MLDFQLMRCIAKIAEVVYPKMESHCVAPLTPRRRTRSISIPYDSPSPPAHDPDSEDSNNTAEIDSTANAREAESHKETVKDQPEIRKVHHDDPHEQTTIPSSDNPQRQSDVGSGDHGSTEAQTPESKTTPQHSAAHPEGGKQASAITKMLFEILQNLLADILTILEKVM